MPRKKTVRKLSDTKQFDLDCKNAMKETRTAIKKHDVLRKPPADPDEQNDQRAKKGYRALRAYVAAVGGNLNFNALDDLLCDLRHFADWYGLDFEAANGNALRHYEEETNPDATPVSELSRMADITIAAGKGKK